MVLSRWMCSMAVVACCGMLATAAAAGDRSPEWTMGVATSEPVALGMSTFTRAIEDPANPFWLLKFYAPWCGHCKRMVPVLEKVAPQTSGIMSIGKIDCTQEKKLCDQYKVRGYPTLKFSLDGVVHDYSGGRYESDLLAFAKKMTRPILSPISSVTAAVNYAHKESDTGVIFLAYDPKLHPQRTTDVAQATLLTQVLAQVARKHRALTEFFVLVPDETTAEIDATLTPELASTLTLDKDPFICRIERFVPLKCAPGLASTTTTATTGQDDETSTTTTSSTTDINSVELNEFIQTHHVPTVAQLGPSNFQVMSRKGRPLVIGVVDRRGKHKQQVDEMEQALVHVATTEPFTSKYYFGWMDGGQFYRFLEQFNIDKEKDLPTIFVLDQTNQVFWYDSTYFEDSSSSSLQESAQLFLNHVHDGTVPKQITKAGAKGMARVVNRLLSAMNEYHPWSVILLVMVVVAFALAIAAIASPGEPIPPLPPKKKTKQPSTTTTTTTTTTAPQETTTEQESKKEK